MAEKAAKTERRGTFKPGQSGNPAGKPKGTRNATTVAMEALMDGESEALTRKAIELAKAGEIATALRRTRQAIYPRLRRIGAKPMRSWRLVDRG